MKLRTRISTLAVIPLLMACLWDDDTLSAEAKKLPSVIDAIVGRVEVNPPEYYKARIQLSKARLQSNQGDYEAYDNIAVAYDKLGDSEGALEVLRRKERRLLANDPTRKKQSDHWYRFFANNGTALAHLWFREGVRSDTIQLKRAEAQLETALAINPDAHFGREKIQLEILRMVRAQ